VQVGDFFVRSRHVDICREDGDEEGDESPDGCFAKCWNEQADAACDFSDATDGDQCGGRGKLGRNDFLILSGRDEMESAGDDEAEGGDVAEDGSGA